MSEDKIVRNEKGQFTSEGLIGNQLSVGNNGGRPQVRYPLKLAEELLEWAHKRDSINLNAFCVTRTPPLPPPKLSDYAKECPELMEAVQVARGFLGARRELMLSNGQLANKAYDLNARVYDYYIKEEHREQAVFEASLAKKDDNKASAEDIARAMSILEQVTRAQEALKRAEMRSKADNKSECDTGDDSASCGSLS